MTLEELKALYAEKGATQRREEQTESGTQYYDEPVQLGEGWTAWEKAPVQIGMVGEGMDAMPVFDPTRELGGFQKQEGDYITAYDLNGNVVDRWKWNENMLKSTIKDLGPIAMAALTMGGGAGMLGNALFGLEGAAASAAGGALAGGVNAYGNDQDILKGALLGGAAGAGGAKIGDTGLTVGDVKKAYDFSQNPTLAGAANLASPYIPNVSVGDGAVSLNDVLKGVSTAQALGSGDYNQIFKALTGVAKDQGNLKSSLAGFEANPEDFIQGYFQPGGEGYIDPTSQEMTVREEPENLDALLRSLSPYEVDGGTSKFAHAEDIPEFETVDKRPVTSFDTIFGTPDILQTVDADLPELTITGDRPVSDVPSIRTKEIKSDIPTEITADQIDKLFPDLKPEDILQTITQPGAKVAAPAKTTTPGTTSTKQALANLGLGSIQQATSQDPYADIKLMEDMFGPDIAYKLISLGGNKRK